MNGADVLFCQFCGTRLAADRLPAAPPATAIAAISAVAASAAAPSNRATDRMIEGGPNPMAAAARVAQQSVGFKLIVVHRDGTDGITYNLLGDQIDIGRTEGDLLFEDPHLAPRHARVSASLTGRVLTPLETRNGVYVRLRGSIDLQDGDTILVGKQVLRFELLTDIERNLRPAVEHGVVVFGTPVRPPWARIRQITPAAITRDVYHLTRPEVVLGRESGDVVFSDDEFMSRRHVQIAFRNGRGHLEDLGSSNGTFLRLRGPHGLSSGDLIRMGDELLRFEIG
ncbi:MAG TPA: FHA domain-containing protein [Polyangia bacterium]|nr:FHA domain-containing protein [Polyangia bacterium]